MVNPTRHSLSAEWLYLPKKWTFLTSRGLVADAPAMPHPTPVSSPTARTDLLSNQVTAARYFFLRQPPGGRVGLVLGGRERCAPDYCIDRRRFPFNILEFIAEGHGQLELEGEAHDLRPGMVFFYGRRDRCIVRNDPAAPMEKYFACFGDIEGWRQLREARGAARGAFAIGAIAEFQALFEDLIREGRHNSEHAERIASARFELILAKLPEAAERHGHDDAVQESNFLRCQRLIDHECHRFRALPDIAAAAGLAPGSISRLFRQHLGVSPYQYLLRRKMLRAAELILHSGVLVKEAAAQVGFPDPYHFSRRFRAVMGMSPVALRAGGKARAKP
jgi:AraC family transcriptional regulator